MSITGHLALLQSEGKSVEEAKVVAPRQWWCRRLAVEQWNESVQVFALQRSSERCYVDCRVLPGQTSTWLHGAKSNAKSSNVCFQPQKKNYTLTPCTYKLPKRTAKSYVTYTLPEQNKL